MSDSRLSTAQNAAASDLSPCRLLQVAAGAGHTLAICDGSSYAWGLNADGQACSAARHVFQCRVDATRMLLTNVMSIAARAWHSARMSDAEAD